MKLRLIAFSSALLATVGATTRAQAPHRASDTLTSFQSDAELMRYLKRLVDEQTARRARLAAAHAPPCIGAASTSSVTTTGGMTHTIVRGRIADRNGASIGQAMVILGGMGQGVTTDTGGRFRVLIPADSLAKPRTVSLVARRIGYDARRQDVTIQRGDSATVNFTLCQQELQLQSIVTTATAAMDSKASADNESVTNTQHQGVDEGGIVKLHGDYLVMLRRGRLFTVHIGDRSLKPIAAVNAFGPGIDARNAWYDEMIVSGDKVIVIGYSYQRGGTELGVFHIDRTGGLRYLATYQLRSNDYYSARNYASRLVDGKLVFYAPLDLASGPENVLASLPALRKWRGDTSEKGFERIVTPRRVYRPARALEASEEITLHSVTSCDLSTDEMECDASVIIGPAGRTFYVSPTSVYVWVSPWNPESAGRNASMVYRMPLDGSAPSALATSGAPIDQFSFLEDEDGFLNVLVRAESGGDAMWRVRSTSSSLALLRVPIEAFGDGSKAVASFRYRELPGAEGYDFQNRFVGSHLLYGTGNGWGRPRTSTADLFTVGIRNGETTRIAVPHGVDRIEALGSNAVVIGASGKDLGFTGIRLGNRPEIAQRFTLADASQGELRSHGFFYKPDGADSGVIGLPVRGAGRPGYEHLVNGSASILFLRNARGTFQELGELASSSASTNDDRCVASCVDWYGNARPLFARGRVFALLGYELVEGVVSERGIREVGRITYAPPVVQATRE